MLRSCRNQSSDLQKKSVYRFLYAWGTGLEYNKEIVVYYQNFGKLELCF